MAVAVGGAVRRPRAEPEVAARGTAVRMEARAGRESMQVVAWHQTELLEPALSLGAVRISDRRGTRTRREGLPPRPTADQPVQRPPCTPGPTSTSCAQKAHRQG